MTPNVAAAQHFDIVDVAFFVGAGTLLHIVGSMFVGGPELSALGGIFVAGGVAEAYRIRRRQRTASSVGGTA